MGPTGHTFICTYKRLHVACRYAEALRSPSSDNGKWAVEGLHSIDTQK